MTAAEPYLSLLQAMLSFNETLLLEGKYSKLQPFHNALQRWGTEFIDIEPHYLPVADRLDLFLPKAVNMQAKQSPGQSIDENCVQLIAEFARIKHLLKFEQSYKKQDNLVGDDMLAGYGFAEITGKLGPLQSDLIRSGMGIWGPQIHYPTHHHQAEEVYIVLRGSAKFVLDGQPPVHKTAGDAIFVRSNMDHGFYTEDDVFFVLYYWLGGDLRQTSSFQ